MPLHIVTWNMQGLRSPQTQSKILRHLQKLKADIALLQETHLTTGDFYRLKKWWVGEVIGSPAIKRKGGVISLLHKKVPYTVTKTETDSEGCRITLTLLSKSKGHPLGLTITNMYAPNTPTKEYIQNLTD